MNTWTCTRQGELYHHGIKGQKWGVRRFQNKDGSLTPAGKKRYDEPNVGRKFVQKTSESVTIDGQTFKVYGRNNKQYADKVAKKAKNMGVTVSRESKTKEAKKTKNMGATVSKETKKYKIPENKSLHRLKLEEKYMENGMTREQAEQAAAKRIRTEKFVAAAAAVTVASAVAYANYKGYTSDKIIKENSDFQRIMRLDPNAELRKDSRLYVTIDKKDKVLYKGMFADHSTKLKSDNEKIYDITVRNRKEIRIASEKRARDTFAKLFRENDDFRRGFMERLDRDSTGFNFYDREKMFRKLQNGDPLTDRELKGKAYDVFNILLAAQGERTERNANIFYESLRKQGVNAIKDINDSKVNNYHAKLPVIIFDTDYDYVKKRIMDDSEIQENINKYVNFSANSMNKVIGASLVGMYASIPVYNKAMVDKEVLLYKQEHPNTNMSDSEITAMVKEKLKKKT